ncbi:precorrin-3B synthase [Winogradskya consettensis]|uniref:precorrin-3B synthase n=1 Tax=Winogradskya consettensis TaxID=113560 RepID=UPI001FD27F69|nr:precorrin-3B synthase [Actinoplanes consettensis]
MSSPAPLRPPAGAVRLPAGSADRAEQDACPGALRLHDAADGPLARIRIPGGRITGAQLAELHSLAEEWGDGHIELTSRANLQLRALRNAPPLRLEARLTAAGLLPSQTHELVRNIAASPLIRDPAPIAALDAALCADPALAALPGRFLFALDDGTGDVAYSADAAALHLPAPPADPSRDQPGDLYRDLSGDLSPRAPGMASRRPRGDLSGGLWAVLFAGRDVGLRVAADQVVPALIAAAHAFIRLASDPGAGDAIGRRAWRVRELADGPARMGALVAEALGVPLDEADPALVRSLLREPVGRFEQRDGRVALGALVPLGRLDAVQLKVLESASDLVFTPWRGVVLPDLTVGAAIEWIRKLAGAGIVVSADSAWAGVTSCAGRPGCAKALADVRGDATAVAERDDVAVAGRDGLPVHWVGCVRGCGSPAGPHVRVEATGQGYLVSSPRGGGTADAAEVGALVAGLRKG